MLFMATRFAALLLALALLPGGARACSIIIQITLEFPENSSELDRAQIIRLVNWLTEVKSWYRYEDADVEGSASTETPDNKNLARQRAEVTSRALQTFYEGLPVHLHSYSYPPSIQSKPHAAVIQLSPLNPPKCGSVPIPGFKY
jgi:hypothetical protein